MRCATGANVLIKKAERRRSPLAPRAGHPESFPLLITLERT